MSNRKTIIRMSAMLLFVALLFGGVFGWGAIKSYFIAQFLAGFANQTQSVATITAGTSTWQPQMQAIGSITAVNGAALSSELPGIVDSIEFDSGADVRKGQLLLTLRPNNDPAVLAQLQATAQLDAITEARDEKQLAADAISQAQLDSDRAQLKAANAQVAAQAALIAEKQIRAPFAGRLGIRQVDLGEYIPAGTNIVQLEQLNPVYADFYLPQQALAQLQAGQSVNVTLDAYPGQVFAGKVSAISPAVDVATRSIQVRATLANDKFLLRPGMFGNVNLQTGTAQNFVTLPQTAVTYNSYGDTVYIVQHGKDAKGNPTLTVAQVFVTLGDTRGDQVSVLSGVKPGDEIVVAGQVKLHNGALVTVNNALVPPASATPTPPNE